MYNILTQQNLRWASHLNRLEDCRLPKQILYSEHREGSHKTGRPKLKHKDPPPKKKTLGVMNIPFGNTCPKIKKKWGKKISTMSASDMMDSL